MEKWARTRRLIALGELVQKSGLADVTGNDLVSLFGAMLELADDARNSDGAVILTSWQQRGEQALEVEVEASKVIIPGHRDG